MFKLCVCDIFTHNTSKANVRGVCEVWTAVAYLVLCLIQILGNK